MSDATNGIGRCGRTLEVDLHEGGDGGLFVTAEGATVAMASGAQTTLCKALEPTSYIGTESPDPSLAAPQRHLHLSTFGCSHRRLQLTSGDIQKVAIAFDWANGKHDQYAAMVDIALRAGRGHFEEH